jgi:HAD superfamily hydrolase (TIGR01509 family)
VPPTRGRSRPTCDAGENVIRAVVFDLDGVLVESEEDWERARHDVVAGFGGIWSAEDQLAILGTNMRQCCHYINDRFSSPYSVERLGEMLTARRMELYGERLVVLPGAIEAVTALAPLYPLAIASSSPAAVIRFVVERIGVGDHFQVVASSDEVERGKPAPDVYRLACERLGIPATEAVAFEDSGPGIRSANAAGLGVIAVPNPTYPPTPETLALANHVLVSLADFHPELLQELGTNPHN